MKRKIMSHKTDKKVFKRTAESTKKINIQPVIMRGGYRL